MIEKEYQHIDGRNEYQQKIAHPNIIFQKHRVCLYAIHVPNRSCLIAVHFSAGQAYLAPSSFLSFLPLSLSFSSLTSHRSNHNFSQTSPNGYRVPYFLSLLQPICSSSSRSYRRRRCNLCPIICPNQVWNFNNET